MECLQHRVNDRAQVKAICVNLETCHVLILISTRSTLSCLCLSLCFSSHQAPVLSRNWRTRTHHPQRPPLGTHTEKTPRRVPVLVLHAVCVTGLYLFTAVSIHSFSTLLIGKRAATGDSHWTSVHTVSHLHLYHSLR